MSLFRIRSWGHGPARIAPALALPLLIACYAQTPVMVSDVGPGTTVVLELTDRGRAELADSIGPRVDRVAGVLRAVPDSSLYEVAVADITLLGGQRSRWAGERVRIPRDYVGRVYERRFSRSRTALAASAFLAAAAAFIVTRDLIGGGSSGSGDQPPPNEQ